MLPFSCQKADSRPSASSRRWRWRGAFYGVLLWATFLYLAAHTVASQLVDPQALGDWLGSELVASLLAVGGLTTVVPFLFAVVALDVALTATRLFVDLLLMPEPARRRR